MEYKIVILQEGVVDAIWTILSTLILPRQGRRSSGLESWRSFEDGVGKRDNGRRGGRGGGGQCFEGWPVIK
jgi:hypothetical protein